MRKPIVTYKGKKLCLKLSTYPDNCRLYFCLEYYDYKKKKYKLWDDITVNMTELDNEKDNYIFINPNLNLQVYQQLVTIKLLKEIETVNCNSQQIKKCEIDMGVAYEYLNTVTMSEFYKKEKAYTSDEINELCRKNKKLQS